MPLDYNRLIADIRLDLDNPDEIQPSNDAIMLAVADVSQLLHVQAQNTGEGWSVRYEDLSVSANEPRIPLTMADFGKPVRIHTLDPADRNHLTRKIEIVDRQDIENYYSGPAQVQGGLKHNAEAIVLWWENGQPMLEFFPTPSQSCQYRVWYEIGELPEASLGTGIPVLAPFHRYVRVRAALALLGKCFWSRLLGVEPQKIAPDATMKMMATHAERQRVDLIPLEAEYRKAYQEYIATSTQAGTGEPAPYGAWSENYRW